jgi:uncharacterized protein DUF1634
MKDDLRRPIGFETLLAGLLGYGTWLASAVVAVGIAVTSAERSSAGPMSPGARIVMAGIALFIALPVLRLLVMLVVFLRQRDYRFVAITALVLTIILLGLVLGMRMSTIAER